MRINSSKLDDLHQYFVDGGSTETEDIADFLKGTKEDVTAYVNALKKKHPDVYGSVPVEEVVEKENDTLSYSLLDEETGLTKPLEVVRTKKSVCYLQVVEPKEIVKIIVGGEKIEVDLIKLRKRSPGDKIGEHLVGKLIAAAELAQG
jgi:hypothetical protein